MSAVGFCECGCGLETRIARETNKKYGTIKGMPNRFIFGHQLPKSKNPEYLIDQDTGCWNWQRSKSRYGYGKVRIHGTWHRAHRVAWARENGPIPEGMVICHSCDNKACVNPAHLFCGTQADNVRDMDAKGRRISKRGTENKFCKMTEQEVLAIFLRCQSGEAHLRIAKSLGVSPSHIGRIARKEAWAHILNAIGGGPERA